MTAVFFTAAITVASCTVVGSSFVHSGKTRCACSCSNFAGSTTDTTYSGLDTYLASTLYVSVLSTRNSRKRNLPSSSRSTLVVCHSWPVFLILKVSSSTLNPVASATISRLLPASISTSPGWTDKTRSCTKPGCCQPAQRCCAALRHS